MPHLAHALDHGEEAQYHPSALRCLLPLSMHYDVAGRFSNHIDNQVAILDCPDDHYAARGAPKRKVSPASLCQDNNIRITVLGGVLHLAALGRLLTEPELVIPTEHGMRNANEDLRKEARRLEKDVGSYTTTLRNTADNRHLSRQHE